MADLNKWLKVLDVERDRVEARIRETCSANGVVIPALGAVEVNYAGCRYWLLVMSDSNSRLQDDLTQVEEDYEKNMNYRGRYDRFYRHLDKLRKVPDRIRDGMFEPDEER